MQLEEEMTITIFTIISALATLAYSIVAFRTLLEIKAQREATYRPDIIIDENIFYIYSCQINGLAFPTEYSYEKKGENYKASRFSPSAFNINLFNIGLASAKEVRITYSFDLDKIISIIQEQNKKLPKDKIITIKRENAVIEFCSASKFPNSFHSIENQLSIDINHILPVNINNIPASIRLPSYLLMLHSILIYNFYFNNKIIKDIPELPTIKIKINYLDIGNKSHTKELDLAISYHGGNIDESWNSFKIKRRENLKHSFKPKFLDFTSNSIKILKKRLLHV